MKVWTKGCCLSVGDAGIWGSHPPSCLGHVRSTLHVSSLDPVLFQEEQLGQGLHLWTCGGPECRVAQMHPGLGAPCSAGLPSRSCII